MELRHQKSVFLNKGSENIWRIWEINSWDLHQCQKDEAQMKYN